MFQECAPATAELLGHERVAWLRDLPAEAQNDGLAIVHAAPGDLWRAPQPGAEESELLAAYLPLAAETAVYGHIHRPFVRRLECADGRQLRQCRDALGRRSASVIPLDRQWRQPRLIRVAYDVEREAAILRASSYPDATRLVEMRRRGAFVRPVAFGCEARVSSQST